jgi:hypothetical protein
MKYKLPLVICIVFSFLLINGCSAKINNSATFQNLSAGTFYVNFRGSAVTVTSGGSSSIQEIQKGTYSYSTTYEIPSGTISQSTQGDVKGNITMNAGTKILIIYSSTLINGAYTLYATLSSSDSQTTVTGP